MFSGRKHAGEPSDADTIDQKVKDELQRTTEALQQAMLELRNAAGHDVLAAPQLAPRRADASILRGLLTPLLLAALAITTAMGLGMIDLPFNMPHVGAPAGSVEAHDVLHPGTFQNKYQITHRLSTSNTARLLPGLVQGPEHIVILPSEPAGGRDAASGAPGGHELWLSSENGTIYSVGLMGDGRVDEGSLRERVYAGPGRVLGFDASGGHFYLCNAVLGLLHWRLPAGPLTVAANQVSASSPLQPGAPLTFVNSAAVSPSTGKVYFTASTDIPPLWNAGRYDTLRAAMLTALSARKAGMVLEYDPLKHTVTCLAERLAFANGVALAADESYLLFAETFSLTVWKLWLSGAQAGSMEEVLTNLPAFPDNLHALPDRDSFWLGFTSKPTLLHTNAFLARNKAVRTLAAYLPASLRENLVPQLAGGLEFKGDGSVLTVAVDPAGAAASATAGGVLFDNGRLLYMGTLTDDYVSVADLEKAAVSG